jgi:hydroxymethylbilane synthase
MIIAALQPHIDKLPLEIVALSTSGDKVLNKPIAELGATGVFVKELEDALLQNQVDLVVHSLKDLPTEIPKGLCLSATLFRDDPRDVLVSRNGLPFAQLPAGSRVATSSRRRAAQLSSIRKDLQFVDVRGNVPTRLRKLDEGECDAMVLAAAGLSRLQLADRITEYFEPDISIPAAGQGALAVECREDDTFVRSLLHSINDLQIEAEVTAERSFLRVLGGGCSVPIGVLARYQQADNTLIINACIADGQRIARTQLTGPAENAEQLGVELAHKMLSEGAKEILENIMGRPIQTISPP